jgi:hypothetical protein
MASCPAAATATAKWCRSSADFVSAGSALFAKPLNEWDANYKVRGLHFGCKPPTLLNHRPSPLPSSWSRWAISSISDDLIRSASYELQSKSLNDLALSTKAAVTDRGLP